MADGSDATRAFSQQTICSSIFGIRREPVAIGLQAKTGGVPKDGGLEYESVFGYDTEAAMHCLRLYLECIELMRFGTITLPRPEREYLIEARSGEWTLEKFRAEADRLGREGCGIGSRIFSV